MLHTNSRGEEGIFYKVPGRMGVYTLKVSGWAGETGLNAQVTLIQLKMRWIRIMLEGAVPHWCKPPAKCRH